MPIAIKRRQVPMEGATFNTPTAPIGMYNGVYNAAMGLADATSDFMVQQNHKIAQADMVTEMSNFEGFVNQQKNEAKLFRQQNPDSDLPDGKSTAYSQDWDKRVKAIQDYANKNLRYKDSRDEATNFITRQKGIWDYDLRNDAFVSRADTASRKFEEYQADVLNADYSAELKAENSLRKQQGLPELTDKDYRLNLIKSRADALANAGIIHQDDVPRILAGNQKTIEKATAEKRQLAIESTLADVAQKTGSWKSSLELVANPEFQKQTGLTSKEVDSLIEDINSKISVEKRVTQIGFDKQITDIDTKAEQAYLDPNADARDLLKLVPNLPENIKNDDNIDALDKVKERIETMVKGKRIRDEFGPPKTDPKAYNNSVDSLLSFYDNLDSKIFNESINNYWLGVSTTAPDKKGDTEIIQGQGKLSDEDRAKFLKLSSKEMPYATVQSVKEAVEFGKNTLPSFWTGKEKDNARIAQYNKGLLDWIDKSTDTEKGTFPTSEEVFKESRRLYGAIQKPPKANHQMLYSTSGGFGGIGVELQNQGNVKIEQTPANQEALDWAKQNPDDPRATKILNILGAR